MSQRQTAQRASRRALAGVVWLALLLGCSRGSDATGGDTAAARAAGGGSAGSAQPGAAPAVVAADAGREASPEPATPSAAPEPELAPIDQLFWENQSWKPGGSAQRLTLWADGRSEISVTGPTGYGASLRPRPGWVLDAKQDRFVRKNPLPRAAARRRFALAVAAGIDQLRTFKPAYYDGAGTLVGYRRAGKLTETVVPMFEDKHKSSANAQTYRRVADVMAKFETDAYEFVPTQ